MHFSRVFGASTYMLLGDGSSNLFWEDKWLDWCSIQDIVPDLFALILRHPRKHRIVREALVESSWMTDITGALSALALWQYVQVRIRLCSVQLSA
jgi:hypothetical protein